MATAIILVALCASVFGVFYMFFTTRTRERMAMIEKGIETPKQLRSRQNNESRVKTVRQNGKFLLKIGTLFTGVGVGFILSVLFDNMVSYQVYPLLVIGIIFVTGGLGMVAGFLIGRRMDKRDERREQ